MSSSITMTVQEAEQLLRKIANAKDAKELERVIGAITIRFFSSIFPKLYFSKIFINIVSFLILLGKIENILNAFNRQEFLSTCLLFPHNGIIKIEVRIIKMGPFTRKKPQSIS